VIAAKPSPAGTDISHALLRTSARTTARSAAMGIGTILLIILILMLIGAFPSWGYSSGWGYGPSGLLGVVVVILLILVLMGRI
jgi:hypothetical protein